MLLHLLALAQPLAPADLAPPHVRVLVMTLGRDAERARYVEDMRRVLPDLETFAATNGFNRTTTARALLRETNMAFHEMCGDPTTSGVREFETWGTLANFITRYRAFARQVADGEAFQAVVEDDQQLAPDAAARLSAAATEHFGGARPVDLVLLGEWGEGYLTSLAAARRLVAGLDAYGIIGCPDQQLNNDLMPNVTARKVSLAKSGLLVGRQRVNRGDCLKTARLSAPEKATLRALRPGPPNASVLAAIETLDALADRAADAWLAEHAFRDRRAFYYEQE